MNLAKNKFLKISLVLITIIYICLIPIYLLWGLLVVFSDGPGNINAPKICRGSDMFLSDNKCDHIKCGWPLVFQEGYGFTSLTPTTSFNYPFLIVDLLIFLGVPSLILYFLIRSIKRIKTR